MTKVWIPEADYVVQELWGKVEPHVIASIINAWTRYIDLCVKDYKGTSLIGSGGVIYCAFRLGLIDEEERAALREQEKKRRKKLRVVAIERGDKVSGYTVPDYVPPPLSPYKDTQVVGWPA
jgi:hypothetical protein